MEKITGNKKQFLLLIFLIATAVIVFSVLFYSIWTTTNPPQEIIPPQPPPPKTPIYEIPEELDVYYFGDKDQYEALYDPAEITLEELKEYLEFIETEEHPQVD